MKLNKTSGASLLTAVMTLVIAFGISMMPGLTFASGGSGSGGGTGGVQTPNNAGNWTGTITTPFGTGAFTMRISQSGTSLSGSAHFGAPVFDATLKLAALTLDGVNFSGFVSSGEGSLPITGTLSADGTTITGTVTELQQVWTYVVTRN
jgi:hypothetical protein